MRWPLLLAALLAVGCPRTGAAPSDSGSAPPSDVRPAELGLDARERSALRGLLERRIALARAAGDAAALARDEGLLEVLDSLDGIAASTRAPRDQERDALAALAAWLDEVARAAPQPDEGPGEPAFGTWAAALAAHAEGDLEGALEAGLALLEDLVAAGIDSASLRFQLGEWALELGDGEFAAELFEGAAAVEAGQGWIAEEAPVAAARARTLGLSPEAAALAEAQALADADDLAAADAALDRLLVDGGDPEVLTRARALRAEVRDEALHRANVSLARVEQILEGPGPYEEAARLLDDVGGLPDGTWDRDEHLRLRGWLRNRTGAMTEAERAAQEQEQAATLKDARSLVVAGEYRAALEAYDSLEGTALQATARKEAREAAETYVREERERAGELFVAARKLRDPGEKRAALEEVRTILAGLLEEFPRSSYADRLRTNLDAVEAELGAI